MPAFQYLEFFLRRKLAPLPRRAGLFFEIFLMSDTHGATGGFISYGLGVAAAVLSHFSLSDWLTFLSLILVVLRICYDSIEFFHRRAERKAKIIRPARK